jgi:hypothetical protein
MKLEKVLMTAAFAGLAMGCENLPSAYQGDFVDLASGAKLTLNGGDGVLHLADGRKLESRRDQFKFKNLKEGRPGIFVGRNTRNESLMDIFWVNPNLATREEVEGFVWFQSEILYTIADTRLKDKVSSVQFIHCTDGQMTLDATTRKLQLGCPAGAKNYMFVRKSGDDKSANKVGATSDAFR